MPTVSTSSTSTNQSISLSSSYAANRRQSQASTKVTNYVLCALESVKLQMRLIKSLCVCACVCYIIDKMFISYEARFEDITMNILLKYHA